MPSKLLIEKEVAENFRNVISSLPCAHVTGKGISSVKMGGRVLYREQDIEHY